MMEPTTQPQDRIASPTALSNEMLAYHLLECLHILVARHTQGGPQTALSATTRIALCRALVDGGHALRYEQNNDLQSEYLISTKGAESVLEYERTHCRACNDTGAVQKGLPCPACKRDPFDTEPEDVHPIRGAS